MNDFPILGHLKPALLEPWAQRHLERSDSATPREPSHEMGRKGEKHRETPRFLRKKTWSLFFWSRNEGYWMGTTMFGWLDCLFIGNLIITNMTIIRPSYTIFVNIMGHESWGFLMFSDLILGHPLIKKKTPWANHGPRCLKPHPCAFE